MKIEIDLGICKVGFDVTALMVAAIVHNHMKHNIRKSKPLSKKRAKVRK